MTKAARNPPFGLCRNSWDEGRGVEADFLVLGALQVIMMAPSAALDLMPSLFNRIHFALHVLAAEKKMKQV